jgi:hypothetical protein
MGFAQALIVFGSDEPWMLIVDRGATAPMCSIETVALTVRWNQSKSALQIILV